MSDPLVFKTSQKAWVYDGDTDTLTQITAPDYPALTVPGIAVLDGTYYVMLPDGTIQGSDIDDPFTWNALNFINAEVEKDGGVAITKYLNYVLAFGTWSTEFFYDAQQPAPSSPLLRADNYFMQIGCASARSIAICDNSIVWIAQEKEEELGATAGRSIVMLTGTQYHKISTPAVERILNADDLSEVYSMSFKSSGHSFYALTLVNSNISLIYDFASGIWNSWTSEVQQSPKSVTSLILGSDGVTATATVSSHGYLDGDIVVVAGATPSGYNGTYNITYVDANTFTYQTTGIVVTPATGTITSTGYTEQYLRFIDHAANGNLNLFLDKDNGKVYQMLPSQYNDAGAYTNFLVRTTNLDAGTNHHKHVTSVSMIGDKVNGNVMLRYSKDDYQTNSNYRKQSMILDRVRFSSFGRARRMSFDVRVTDNVPIRLERMDISVLEEEKKK